MIQKVLILITTRSVFGLLCIQVILLTAVTICLNMQPNGDLSDMMPVKIYDNTPSELDVFMDFFPSEMFDVMVEETNLYAHQWKNIQMLHQSPEFTAGHDSDHNGIVPQNQSEDYSKSNLAYRYAQVLECDHVIRFQAVIVSSLCP